MSDYAIHDTTLTGIANTIRKKDGTAALIDPADYADRINLMGMLEEKTQASASVCAFDDGADDVPTDSVKITIPASLSGVSSVTETQTGRNLIPFAVDYPNFTQTKNDMTISVLANGKVKFNGTTTASTDFTFYPASSPSEPHLFVKNGTYTFSNIGSASVKMVVSGGSNNGFPYREITNGYYTGAVTDETKPFNYIIFRIASGVTLSDVVIEPMLEAGSTAHDYEAYNATQYTASLGRTIYGGQVDIVKGEGKATFARIDLGSLTYTLRNNVGMQSNGISSLIQNPPDNYTKTTAIASDYTSDTWQIVMNSGTSSGLFGVSGGYVCFSTTETDPDTFKASMSGKYLVFPLATPTDFTFTGQEVSTRLGYNAFWSDEGDTEVTYRASGTITPVPVVPTLISKTITENGTYDAEDDDADGYSEVTVNVSGVPSGDHDDPLGIMTDYTRFNVSNLYSAYYIGNGELKKEVVFQMASATGYEGFCISLDDLGLTNGTQYTLSFVLNVPTGVTFSGSYPWGIKYSSARVPASGSANTNTFNITPTVNFLEQTGSQNVSITFTAGQTNYLLVLLARIAGSNTSWITMRDVKIEEVSP